MIHLNSQSSRNFADACCSLLFIGTPIRFICHRQRSSPFPHLSCHSRSSENLSFQVSFGPFLKSRNPLKNKASRTVLLYHFLSPKGRISTPFFEFFFPIYIEAVPILATENRTAFSDCPAESPRIIISHSPIQCVPARRDSRTLLRHRRPALSYMGKKC